MGKNPIVLGDFATLDKKLEDGLITQDEYQKTFEMTRLHGIRGDIFPFAVGGSDAAAIFGISPFVSPLLLYNEKMGLIKPKHDERTRDSFYVGHAFEAVFRDLFAHETGLRVEPCSLQVTNPDYPHVVANIDGIVWEDGKPGIYEGKTTRFYTKTHDYFAAGEVPIYYEYQVRLYMEMWNLDFAYINCAWGLEPKKDMKWIRIARDESLGREICLGCEEFVLNASKGIKPSNSICESLSLVEKDSETLYGNPNTDLPPVKLSAKFADTFKRIDKIDEAENALQEKIAPALSEIKALQKERKQILSVFPEELKDATVGIYDDGDAVWVVHYDPPKQGDYCLDMEVKAYWKDTYPECYRDVTTYKPKTTRSLHYEKTEVQK